MKEKYISWSLNMSRSSFVVIPLTLFVTGLIIIFGSVSWGNKAAYDYITSRGGSIDTSQYTIILQEHINIYKWIGSILSLISGLGFVKTIEVK
jgi:hypothetical protein